MNNEQEFGKNIFTPEINNEELESEKDFNFQEYLNALSLSPDELKGKKILDVGSAEGEFAAECKGRGIDAEIISLDPHNLTRNKDGESHDKIKGIAEALPLKSDTFDLVISAFAIPISLFEPAEIRIAIKEMLRVVNHGGELRFAPATFYKIGPKFRDLSQRELNYNSMVIKNLLSMEDEGCKFKLKKLKYYEKAVKNVGITLAIVEKT